MKYKIEFTKMVGTGNDFVVVDHRRKRWENSALVRLAKRLTHRQNGIGADGVLFLERSHGGATQWGAPTGKKTHFRMRIFNPDGSEAEMCGNGIRCIADYAYQQRIAPRRMNIETMAGVLEAEVKKQGWIRVMLSPPREWKLPIRFQKGGIILEGGFVNTGVPHAVFFVNRLEQVNVEELGEWIRHHRDFAPCGTNVNFVHCASRRKITVRTYERGVEGETLACGTGVTAAVLVAAQQGKVTPPVEVATRGDEVLWVDFSREDHTITNVWLEGSVRVLFRGVTENV